MAKISTMMRTMTLIVWLLGTLSNVFGLVAYLKTPELVTTKDGVTLCKFSNDPTLVVFGYLSVAFLVATNVAGCLSLFYFYKERSVSPLDLVKINDTRRCTLFTIGILLIFAGVAATCMLLGTITEQVHLSQKDLHYACSNSGGNGVYLLIGTFLSVFSGTGWTVLMALEI